jgi:acyl-CoA synthetase (AMP-forming)/AMP-acid ligase II
MLLIQDLESLNSKPENVITDGLLSCSYKDIKNIFVHLKNFFAQQDVSTKDCLVLECENSLTSALTLLYLLEAGYSFLLVPKEVKTSSPQDLQQSVPRFCRYRIIPESLTHQGEVINWDQPESFIFIHENQEWNNHPQKEDDNTAKLYLRTSGSTGIPKLVVHSHAKVWQNALNCGQRLNLTSDARVAIPVPLYHMYGLGAAFLPSVSVGACIDLQKGANLLRYLQREQEFNPNVAFMTPIFCETLLKGRKSSRPYNFTVAAGDTMKEDTFIKYESQFGCLVRLYGSTEMGVMAAASPEAPLEVRIQKLGLPVSGVQMRVEQNQGEFTNENNDVGELWCQHEYGFEAYIDRDGKPIYENVDCNWFSTKDLGRISSDGYLEVLSRSDRSVNRDGLLVIFSDIEKAIQTIPGIEAVVVEAQGDSQRGKGLIAYCVLTKNSQLSEKEIRASCFQMLPKRAIPEHILLLPSLPLLSNGKVDRQTLIAIGNKTDFTNLVRR